MQAMSDIITMREQLYLFEKPGTGIDFRWTG